MWILSVLERLQAHGHQAVLVGGCVRDGLMGKTPADYDVATSALPDEVCALFAHSVPMGRFGTVCVLLPEGKAEVTTFRADGRYNDHRRPDTVRFGVTLEEDVKRRDFTVNALCFDGKKVIDLCGGRDDLKRRTIRAVGDAKTRFEEDPLRILRAFRFAAALDFSIEKETERAARETASWLGLISSERVGAELERLVCAPYPERGLDALGLLSRDFPTGVRLGDLPSDPETRFAGLFYRSGVSPERAVRFLRSIRRPAKLIVAVRHTLAGLQSGLDDGHLLWRYGASAARRIALLQGRADEMDRLLASGVCYRRDMLALSGRDLAALGVQWTDMRRTFEKMMEYVLEDPSRNTGRALTEFIKEQCQP